MTKFHVNKDTGKVSLCKAGKRPCPLGGSEVHFDSLEEGQRGYETIMKKSLVKTHNKEKSTSPATPLSSIMDLELLNKMVAERYVYSSKHPDDPSLQILTYSPMTQISGKWNSVTKQARGLIVRSEKPDFSDAVIVERPWRKFFTLSQMTGSDGKPAWALGDEEEGANDSAKEDVSKLDFNAPAEVTDKCDGSLGILHEAPDGKLAFSTKGSFASDQAVEYTKMLRDNPKLYAAAEKLKKEHPDTSFMFELVGANNQIVLEYENEEPILLGAVNKKTGKYYSTDDFKDTWREEDGLHCAEKMNAKNLQEALALPDRKNREGVVVRVLSDDPERQMQIKIKQEDYLKLHRMMTGFSKTAARDVVKDSKASVQDILKLAENKDVESISEVRDALAPMKSGKSKFHDNLYGGHKKSLENAMIPVAEKYSRAYNHVSSLPDEAFSGDERKAAAKFAESINTIPADEKSYYFSFFKAKLAGDSLESTSTSNVLRNMAKNID